MTASISYNVIDVFSGVGGISLGFRDDSSEPRCKFKIRLMVDKDKEAFGVAIRNMPEVPFLVADVHDVSGADLRKHAKMSPDEHVHVLVGGPPCQGFSFLGKRVLDDPRNVHLIDFLRLVKELKPWVALMENVPLIKTSHKGSVLKEVEAGLEKLGYSWASTILQASEYGVPQLRKRAFVLAYRKDLAVPPQFPPRTHERIPQALDLIKNGHKRHRYDVHKLPYVSVEEAIGDLPPLQAGEGDEVLFYKSKPLSEFQKWARSKSIAIFNHRSRSHGKDFLEKISVIKEGGRNSELPKHKRFSETYYSQAYARLHRHAISQTVTTSFCNPGSGRFTHYRDLRSITVREAARFQSFPDWFAFEGLLATQMRLVGNAVPPLLARAIRDQIARDLLSTDDPINAPVQQMLPPTREEDPAIRSNAIRAEPSKHRSTDLALRKVLREAGIKGYQSQSIAVPGTPDVTFVRERVAIFIDECFSHGCLKCYRAPLSNRAYWSMKVKRNRDRDAKVNSTCRQQGWKVVRVWEHEAIKTPGIALRKVKAALKAATKPVA